MNLFFGKKKNEAHSSGDQELTKKEKFKKEVKSIIGILFIVLLFRSSFFEPFKIPSGSMIPTLMIGDFILVNKMSYGFKVPFSDYFWDPIYITGPSDPKRGDVIVFKYPENPSLNYIKRVVGLPGETLEIRDKVVYIDGRPLSAYEFDGSEIMADMDDKFKQYNLKFYKSKTGDHNHVIQQNADSIYNSEYPIRKIPKGHFFVMGDNRDFSADSRFWGFVPHENIKGRAILVWFSMIFPWNDGNLKFRPWRIFKSID